MSAPKSTPPSVPPAEAGAASTPSPQGARTGAAGPASDEPGRSTQAAPVGAGAAPVGSEASGSLVTPDGQTRTGAAGPVNAESPAPGRSTSDPLELNVLRDEKYYELLHAEQGHAGLSLVVPAAVLVLIAAASGQLYRLWHHLPITSTPNGFTLLVVLLCAGVVAAHWLLNTADVLPGIDPDQQGDEMVDLHLPERDDLPGPWFTTVAVEHDPRWDKRLATEADL